jgi:predicted RNase H-like HicB family nuclease
MAKAEIIKVLPTTITLRDVVYGYDFLAIITLSGKALMRYEDGEWWMYGVLPPAITENGSTIEEAFSRFRNSYKEVLFDFAQESRDFDQFKANVEQFFYESDVDNEDERLWEESLKEIRTSNCGATEIFTGSPNEVTESKPSQISIERLNCADALFRPSDNIIDNCSFPMNHTTRVAPVNIVNLELTMKEAKALSDIINHGIRGPGDKYFTEIYYALEQAGIKGDNWPYRRKQNG